MTLNRYFRIPHLSESKCSLGGVRGHTISDHGKTKFEEGLKGRDILEGKSDGEKEIKGKMARENASSKTPEVKVYRIPQVF